MIYVDMDGVVSDFDKGILLKYGKTMDQMTNKEQNQFWDHDCANDFFFERLPLIPAGEKLINHLLETKVMFSFLTSTGGGENHYHIAQQKIRFVQEKFKVALPVAVCTGTASKSMFATNRSDMLIDDREKVVTAWVARGGTGVLFNPEDWEEAANLVEWNVSKYL